VTSHHGAYSEQARRCGERQLVRREVEQLRWELRWFKPHRDAHGSDDTHDRARRQQNSANSVQSHLSLLVEFTSPRCLR
jgi:hypothetical protein